MRKLTIVSMAATMLLAVTAAAQDYPSRPITMIVPFAAGGPTDALARIIAEPMRRELGQTIIIENVTGAGGSIGVGRAVRSPADGYTLSIGHLGTHVVNPVILSLNYDTVADLTPVAMLANNPQLVVTRNTMPAKDFRSLIAWMKDHPAGASAGTAGPGSGAHIGGLYFQKFTGAKINFVPYRGTGPAIQDLIAGNIDVIFDQSSNSLPVVRNKMVKVYAVTAKQRLSSAPDIPTVDEAGLPGFHVAIWHALWVPKDTPKPIIDKLQAAVKASLADATVRARLIDLGQDIPTLEQQTPAGLAAYQKAEIDKWWPIIKAAGIKAN
jgi:tripartite-type tricarboxylate transporter receptor subunit TctC